MEKENIEQIESDSDRDKLEEENNPIMQIIPEVIQKYPQVRFATHKSKLKQKRTYKAREKKEVK